MNARLISIFAGLSVLMAAPAVVLLATHAAAQNELPDCVQVRANVRYGNQGYDHWVIIENGCDVDIACEVRTNVREDAIEQAVEAHDRVEVLTFRGSPAREFSPRVQCRLADSP